MKWLGKSCYFILKCVFSLNMKVISTNLQESIDSAFSPKKDA